MKSVFDYSKKEIILSIIFVPMFILIIVIFSPSKEEYLCKEYKRFVNSNYHGTVNKIYIDKKNHNMKVIVLRLQNGSYKRLAFDLDTSIFFSYVRENDTLFKKKGDEGIEIIRNGMDTIININYGVNCN